MKAIIVDDEPLARNELRYLLNEIRHFETIDESETISETLELLLYDDYDVIFLDINLMDESGLALAEKIKKMKRQPFIIFATAHDTYAVKAFELNAIDYILKPFEQQRIAQALSKVESALTMQHEPNSKTINVTTQNDQSDDTHATLPIEVDERIHIINHTDIIAISVNNGITTIHTKSDDFQTTEPLNHYEKRLSGNQFMRVHRATIINQSHIQTIEHWFNYTYQLTMSNQLKVQVSRSYMKQFKIAMGLN
ncbi:response regulator transcription factor LytR [Staphylococcus gallinarum]|uniref:response regulator transcription factor LytR n=1 Tax=Staphylococcus gallinarum TaxID=1293 RepID=UPI000D1C6199|nr:response regulator transcription factor LytR [Staphylococcus gallinarum]MBU7217337.1 response regulator transcription factor LytR [Staphylococcus gallinarum]MCD8792581.1 response regulator transcription factor LytR [Staphylococcus gallinarum]MCD8918454.1 response regulator transcription factor LytR [Staphylococcus gallinarum]PTE38009.1 DNA-binding response regulator [Staphylococcus gallinarum]PTK90037.1 DNA-binding response regulator [Staphylococcus gallinarum]